MLNKTFSDIFKHRVNVRSFRVHFMYLKSPLTQVILLSEHTVGLRSIASSSSLSLFSLLFGALASAVRMLFYCLQLRCSGLCYCCCTKVFLLLLRDPFSDGSNAASKSCAAPSLLWTVAKMKIWGNRSHFSTVHCSAVKQELEIAKNPSNPEGLLKERSFVPSIIAVAASFCIVALILHKVHEKLMLNFEFGSLGFTQIRNPH